MEKEYAIKANAANLAKSNFLANMSFEQGSESKVGTTKGTGLGLPISKEIIDLHHGKIWAENHPDGGAVFSFIIPAEHISH